ncbi:MAG: hypothetical protein M3Z08_20655 [Chloroflexota bacterium]|nr:hypothetical protein [Chloroflexota bacterium]
MQVQIHEAEIVLPLIRPKFALNIRIYLFLLSVWSLGMFIFMMAGVGRHLLSLYPSDWGSVIAVGIGLVLSLLLQGWFLLWTIRQRFAPRPILWISREGIFFTTLIYWSEIKALIPYTAPSGGLAMGIAL